jgi:hypothetical protein
MNVRHDIWVIELINMVGEIEPGFVGKPEPYKSHGFYQGYLDLLTNRPAYDTEFFSAPRWDTKEDALRVRDNLLGTLNCAWVVVDWEERDTGYTRVNPSVEDIENQVQKHLRPK